MNLRQRAVSGATWTAVTFVGGQLIQLATGVMLARILSPSDFGTAGLALAIAAVIAAVNQFGLFASLVQRREVSSAHFDTALWTSLASGGVFGIALAASAGPLSAVFRNPAVAPVLRLYGLLLLCGAFSSVQSGLLVREFRFREVALAGLAGRLAGGGLAVALALRGHGVMSIAWGYVVQVGLTAALQSPAALGHRWPRLRVSVGALKELLGYGIGIMGANLLNQLSAGLDIIITGPLLGAARIGFYSLGSQAGSYLPKGITTVLSSVTFSTLSRLQDDRRSLRSAVLRLSAACSLLASPLLALLAVTAPDLIPTLFGQQWAPAVPLVPLCAATGFIMSLDWVWCEVLKSCGRSSLLFGLLALRVAVLGGAVAAAAGLGLVWVALAVCAVRFIFWLGYQTLVDRTVDLTLREYAGALVPSLAVSAFAAGGALAVRRLAVGWLPTGSVPALMLTCLTGVGLAVALAPLLDRRGLLNLLETGSRLPLVGPACRDLAARLQPVERGRTACMMTVVHAADDARIFHKEAATLAEAGWRVVVLAPGRGAPASSFSVQRSAFILPVAVPGRRFWRMTMGTWRMLTAALRTRAEMYHFHDPELIPAALLLRLLGRRVVYDVHEDYQEQILSKHYLAPVLRRTVSGLFRALEQTSARALSAVVAATETIAARFPPDRTVVVRNYPRANRQSPIANRQSRFRVVHLAGTLTEDRGIGSLIRAMGLLDDNFELVLAGRFIPPDYEARLAALPGWRRVRHIPSLPHEQVWDCYAGCDAGAVCLAPLPRYRVSLPVKLFEFMAAGLPVVVSDFPTLREIVDGSGCGLCVDPQDPAAIAAAIRRLAADRERAAEMGRNGRRAAESRYSWGPEGARLVALYEGLCQSKEQRARSKAQSARGRVEAGVRREVA